MSRAKNRKARTLPRKTIPRTPRYIIIAVISVILIYALTSTYLAYQTPTTQRQTQTIVHYSNNGRFTYLIYLHNNTIYNKTVLYPEEGIIFTQLLDHINATFTYTYEINTTSSISGNCSILGIIQTNLWSKTFSLRPQTPFSAMGQYATATVDFPIDYAYFEQVLEEINTETGVPAQNPVLIIQSHVTITAHTNQGAVFTSFFPAFNLTLGQRTIDVSKNLISSDPGSLTKTITIETPNIQSQRNNWSIISIITLLGLASVVLFTASPVETKTNTVTEVKKIKKKYNEWIVEADEHPDAAEARIVSIKSIQDLAKIGEELGKPIIHYSPKNENDKNNTFYVIDETVFYEYVLKPAESSKKSTTCPQCGATIDYEENAGRKVTLRCPNCGSKAVADVSEEKPWSNLLARIKKRRLNGK